MLPQTLIKGLDQGRLRTLLLLFFLALVIPTAVLIWQAYGQLKWESFHQYRGSAEELTGRIDADLIQRVNTAEKRTFADYSFLVLTGDPSINFLQRSPLAQYPVREELPGIIGYFQVNTDGAFSTPLLPRSGIDPESLGIAAKEYEGRLLLAEQIQEVLIDNQLVRSRPATAGLRRERATLPPSPASGTGETARLREEDLESSLGRDGNKPAEAEQVAAALIVQGSLVAASADKDNAVALLPEEQAAGNNEAYSQQIFDQLNQAADSLSFADDGVAESIEDPTEARQRQVSLGKVSELKLDSAYERKSEQVEQAQPAAIAATRSLQSQPSRAKRREAGLVDEIRSTASRAAESGLAGPSDERIGTFASEVDSFEFSLLDSGHFVLFRKVWREGERYIQGILVDQEAFVSGVLGSRFGETALSAISNLIVAYQDDVIRNIAGSSLRKYPNGSESLDGALLYRSRLSAPLDSLELIFSINRLPPGPGASVLGWVTLVLAVVFCGGFYLLYRLGMGQIRLARQQQDFVSAVSHELKTPLTSIRMYGEMLKEGWADVDKQQDYYEFIHDESERLTRLISNVLQLASITRNEPQLDRKPIAVSQLMNHVRSKIAAQVMRAGFEFSFDSNEKAGQATIEVDEDCFTQIIINLVDNAIKFSKKSQRKCIEIGNSLASSNWIVFTVRDYGAGIPRNQMKKIFRLFYRTESELTRETVGTGIGLAIVHQLTIAMDGKVDVINRDPGAEFRVSFPIRKVRSA